LRIDNEIRRAIFDQLSVLEVQEIALKGGMLTLEQTGIIKALEGSTSLEEVYRVSKKGEFDKKTKKPKKPEAETSSSPEAEVEVAEPEVIGPEADQKKTNDTVDAKES